MGVIQSRGSDRKIQPSIVLVLCPIGLITMRSICVIGMLNKTYWHGAYVVSICPVNRIANCGL